MYTSSLIIQVWLPEALRVQGAHQRQGWQHETEQARELAQGAAVKGSPLPCLGALKLEWLLGSLEPISQCLGIMSSATWAVPGQLLLCVEHHHLGGTGSFALSYILTPDFFFSWFLGSNSRPRTHQAGTVRLSLSPHLVTQTFKCTGARHLPYSVWGCAGRWGWVDLPRCVTANLLPHLPDPVPLCPLWPLSLKPSCFRTSLNTARPSWGWASGCWSPGSLGTAWGWVQSARGATQKDLD